MSNDIKTLVLIMIQFHPEILSGWEHQSMLTSVLFHTDWLFVWVRTDRIFAIRTVYDHVTIQVASRDKLRWHVKMWEMHTKLNVEYYSVLDALEIDSSSGEAMFTIAKKFSSFLDKIGDLEKAKFVYYSALQSLTAYLEYVATINGGDCLDCIDESSSCGIVTTF